MSKGLGNEIYSDSAAFGRIRAIIGVIFGTLIGLGLIIGGIFAIAHKTKLSSETIGISVNKDNNPIPIDQCGTTTTNNNTTYNCNFRLRYTVDGIDYYSQFNTHDSINYSNETKVTIYYDPNNPNNSSPTKDDYHTVGYILLGIGIFLLIGAWVSLWIVLHYKFAAAASGAAGAIGMIHNL